MRTFVTLLSALWLMMPAPARAMGFPDVPVDHWARSSIDALIKNGIQGCSFGLFEGDRIVNRYHVAVMVAKLLDFQQHLSKPWSAEQRQLQRVSARLSKATLDLRNLSARLENLTGSIQATRNHP